MWALKTWFSRDVKIQLNGGQKEKMLNLSGHDLKLTSVNNSSNILIFIPPQSVRDMISCAAFPTFA